MTDPSTAGSRQDPRHSVKAALTPKSRKAGGSTNQPAQDPSQAARGAVENPDYAAFATRVIRAHARRIADGDVDAPADLLPPADEVDAATQSAVNGLRSFGYSWTQIATRVGTTRQAAHQRWGMMTRTPRVPP